MQMAREGRVAEGRGLAILRFANFTVGEQMEEAFALFGRRVLGHDFTADISDECQPVGEAFVQTLLNFLTKTLGYGGAFPIRGNGDLEITAADNCGKIKIAIRRIVHGIAENSQALRFKENGAIDGGVRGCGDCEECALEIFGLKFPRQPAELPRSGELFYFGIGAWGNDGDARAGFKERGYF
jgi:hypothetical protein